MNRDNVTQAIRMSKWCALDALYLILKEKLKQTGRVDSKGFLSGEKDDFIAELRTYSAELNIPDNVVTAVADFVEGDIVQDLAMEAVEKVA
ncbi:MAG: hypothetical protein WC791_03440 [Candidatus Paceibacterota bacterium]|jgi:hypothetical protein